MREVVSGVCFVLFLGEGGERLRLEGGMCVWSLPEFVETDGAALVQVEHPDHHFDGVGVEAGEVAVHECRPEFLFGQLARTRFVDGFEEWEEGGVLVIACVGWRWCRWWS